MLESIAAWLEHLPFAVAISQGDWLFPGIESVHVLALTTVFGSIAMVDLRLINMNLNSRAVADLTREILPWTWCAFVLAAITGSLLFASAATRYYHLCPFRLKMILLMLAGLNMLVFHLGANRHVARWGASGPTPAAARVAGGLSLLIWTAIIVCGRWVGFL